MISIKRRFGLKEYLSHYDPWRLASLPDLSNEWPIVPDWAADEQYARAAQVLYDRLQAAKRASE